MSGLATLDLPPRHLTFDMAGPSRGSAQWSPTVQLAALTVAVWLGSFALSTIRDLADPPAGFALMTASRLLFAVIGMLLCIPLHLLLKRLGSRSFSVRILLLLPAIAVAAMLYTEATLAMQRAAGGGPQSLASGWRFYNTVYWSLFFLAWAALDLALSYSRESAEQASRARLSESLAHEAQLRALRYQIDPHFLFNTLNSVSALVVTGRNEAAEGMLSRLSRYFRASVMIDPNASLPLEDEIELQRLYLEIEQVRFPDLQVGVNVAPDAARSAVPALILQPVVENAIKHGVSSSEAPARIDITARLDGATLVIAVENDSSSAIAGIGTGTGLRNIRERLAALHCDGASLSATAGAGTFRVVIALPRCKQR